MGVVPSKSILRRGRETPLTANNLIISLPLGLMIVTLTPKHFLVRSRTSCRVSIPSRDDAQSLSIDYSHHPRLIWEDQVKSGHSLPELHPQRVKSSSTSSAHRVRNGECNRRKDTLTSNTSSLRRPITRRHRQTPVSWHQSLSRTTSAGCLR